RVDKELFKYEDIQIDTDIYPYSGNRFVNYHITVTDKSIVLLPGDIVKGLFIPMGANIPTGNTIVYVYNSDDEIQSQYNLGVLSEGDNYVDLEEHDIVISEGEYIAVRGLSYYNGLSIPADRFYNVGSGTFFAYPYFYSLKIERTVYIKVIEDIEDKIEELSNDTGYQIKDKTIVMFGDSQVASTIWPEQLMSDLEFNVNSI